MLGKRSSTKRITHEQFVQRVYDAVGDEYEVQSTYTNNKCRIKFLHRKCGNLLDMVAKDFICSGYRCKYCASNPVINTDIFKKRVFALTSGEYEVLGEYVKNTTPILMLHTLCGSEFLLPPKRFTGKEKHGTATRCTVCSRKSRVSKGEAEVMRVLDKLGLEYSYQYRDPACSRKKFSNLSFDFKIKCVDGFALIEYNGNSHYKPCFGSTRENRLANLKVQQERDRFKEKFCEDNDIPLLVISYVDFEHIESIVKEWFSLD